MQEPRSPRKPVVFSHVRQMNNPSEYASTFSKGVTPLLPTIRTSVRSTPMIAITGAVMTKLLIKMNVTTAMMSLASHMLKIGGSLLFAVAACWPLVLGDILLPVWCKEEGVSRGGM